MEPEGSLPYSQQPASRLYPDSIEFSLHHILFLLEDHF